jgi:hypothetical protein
LIVNLGALFCFVPTGWPVPLAPVHVLCPNQLGLNASRCTSFFVALFWFSKSSGWFRCCSSGWHSWPQFSAQQKFQSDWP